ncbi:hypothetical protein BC829DRAFT_289820 [Chytridium lagenaria]|nr:hypothetical protein BC829DRAFT_289820 [Chytridium lagenaria]
MPKIISSSIVSASQEHTGKEKNRLHVYYCICGEFLLILDTVINKLPRRQTDGAYILNTKKRTHKLNTVPGPIKIVKREKGFEKQCRYCCPRCGLFVSYDQNSTFYYFLDGSLRSAASG